MFDRLIRWITATESSTSFAQQVIGLLGWLGVLSIGTFASWQAAVTDWIATYGPAAWLMFGVATAIAAALVFRVVSASIRGLAEARLTRSYAFRGGRINPLSMYYSDVVIDLGEFFSPGPMLYKDRTFKDCQIRGPAVIFVTGTSKWSGCDGHINVVETADERIDSTSVIVFQDVKFLDCTFYRVTVLGPKGLRDRMMIGDDSMNPNVRKLDEPQRGPQSRQA